MAELQTRNVGRIVRDMLGWPVDFEPGPMTFGARRMALVVIGLGAAGQRDSTYAGLWVEQRFDEVEAQRMALVSVQVHAYIHRVLWAGLPEWSVSKLLRALHIWCNALVAASAMTHGKTPGVATRALYAVKVAAYLAEHEGLGTPESVTVKLMAVPKPGQPGLGVGGAALAMEKRLVVDAMYRPEFPAMGSVLQQ